LQSVQLSVATRRERMPRARPSSRTCQTRQTIYHFDVMAKSVRIILLRTLIAVLAVATPPALVPLPSAAAEQLRTNAANSSATCCDSCGDACCCCLEPGQPSGEQRAQCASCPCDHGPIQAMPPTASGPKVKQLGPPFLRLDPRGLAAGQTRLINVWFSSQLNTPGTPTPESLQESLQL